MTYIKRSVLDQLFLDMVRYRDKARAKSEYATAVSASYVAKYETGGSHYASKGDAELAASTDWRFLAAVADNQMYDRFATRDATVLAATLKMIEMDLLTLRDID
jgi:hypothetical protein